MKRRVFPFVVRLTHRVTGGVFRPRVEDEVSEEFEFHLEMLERHFRDDGLSPEKAREEALRVFGNTERLRTDAEHEGRRRDREIAMKERWAESARDVQYALRQMMRAPVFATVAVLTLALGIGANSAVFSVVNGVLLEPLPYEAPEELVTVTSAFPSMGFDRFWISPPEFFELKEWNRSFSDIGGYRTGTSSIETTDQPLRVASAVASASFFTTLGVQAAAGRTYTADEDLPGADPVVVLSDGIWRSAFGSDPQLIGKTIRVDGQPQTVVGILPAGFDIEDAEVDVWQPLNIDPNDHQNRRGNHFLNLVARLSPGTTVEQAGAELDQLLVRWNEEYAGSHTPSADFHELTVRDFRTDVLGEARTQVLLLLGAVGFVLLIACANVANLLLARSEARSKEVAVRVAMGAGRGRLSRQFLTEGITLALTGGAAGLVLGYVALQALLAANPDGIPRSASVGMDGTVMLFTLALSVATGLLFGLAPLLNTSASKLGMSLREGGARSTANSAGRRMRRSLVVAEVALAVILLTGSGLMVRSLSALHSVDPGFEPENLLTFNISAPNTTYPDPANVGDFYDRLLDELRAIPGVERASAMNGLPPLRNVNANDTEFEGVEQIQDGPAHNVDYWQFTDLGYLDAMGIQVVEGRDFDLTDLAPGQATILVNERLAQVFYTDGTPMGRRIRPPSADTWFTVVGIVEDVKQSGLSEPTGTEIYFLSRQAEALGFSVRTRNIVMKTQGDPLALVPSVRRAVWNQDASLPLSDVQTMEQNIASSVARPRFLTMLLGVFAGVALVLAAVGTYGVIAYSVAQRSREIGIRMAMGAGSGSVVALVVRNGVVLALTGAGLGIAGAFLMTRFLAAQLYEVSATDPSTFVVAPLFLTAVAVLASFIPARRGTRVDPVTVLKQE
jgi:predicted permease